MSASAIAPARPLSADRRSFLAAGMATIVAVSVAAPSAASSPRAEWDAAEARFKAAEAAFAPYANAVRTPEDIRKEISSSYRDLLNTPAPDAKALRWKLSEILEDADENCALADFDRLFCA